MSTNMEQFLFISSPVIIGVIVALVNHSYFDNKLEELIRWLSSRKLKITSESGKFNKYFVRPFLWLALKISGITENITHSGLKTGIRLAAYIYLAGLFLYLFITFVFLIAAFIVIGIAFWIYDKFTSSGTETVVTRTEWKSRIFGDDYFETRDADGKLIAVSEEKERFFGDKYVETRDASGKVISTSEENERLFGDNYTETRDATGKVISTSEVKERLFGDNYVETKDTSGIIISTSEKKERLFGDNYLETTTEIKK
jgi:hypothetical protein